jgi:hypothetical protein
MLQALIDFFGWLFGNENQALDDGTPPPPKP